MTSEMKEETRKFRGTDVTVYFIKYHYNPNITEFDATVIMSIDGCVFSGHGYKNDKESAYADALEKLERNLIATAKGNRVEEAEHDLRSAQEELTYRRQEQNTAEWFLKFTKDKA